LRGVCYGDGIGIAGGDPRPVGDGRPASNGVPGDPLPVARAVP